MVYGKVRRIGDAEKTMLAANDVFEKLVREHPTVRSYQRNCAANQHNLGVVCTGGNRFADAERWYRLAMTTRERLHQDEPGNATFTYDLAVTYRSLAALTSRQGKRNDVIAWNAKAIALVQPLVKAEPGNALAKNLLWSAAAGKAQVLAQQDKNAEALADWDLALEHLTNENMRPLLRTYRAGSRAAAGDWRSAGADIDAVLAGSKPDSFLFYHLARAQGLRIVEVLRDASLPETQRQAHADEFGRRGVEWLKKARDGGDFKSDDPKTHKDPALKALRERADFQAAFGAGRNEAVRRGDARPGRCPGLSHAALSGLVRATRSCAAPIVSGGTILSPEGAPWEPGASPRAGSAREGWAHQGNVARRSLSSSSQFCVGVVALRLAEAPQGPPATWFAATPGWTTVIPLPRAYAAPGRADRPGPLLTTLCCRNCGSRVEKSPAPGWRGVPGQWPTDRSPSGCARTCPGLRYRFMTDPGSAFSPSPRTCPSSWVTTVWKSYWFAAMAPGFEPKYQFQPLIRVMSPSGV